MQLTQFEIGYLECALWSTTDENDVAFDSNYAFDDISNESIELLRKECNEFITKAGPLLDDLDDSQAGHDFWLTRNRHGTGFWDRGLGEVGEKLTALSREFSEVYIYLSDDGKLVLE